MHFSQQHCPLKQFKKDNLGLPSSRLNQSIVLHLNLHHFLGGMHDKSQVTYSTIMGMGIVMYFSNN